MLYFPRGCWPGHLSTSEFIGSLGIFSVPSFVVSKNEHMIKIIYPNGQKEKQMTIRGKPGGQQTVQAF